MDTVGVKQVAAVGRVEEVYPKVFVDATWITSTSGFMDYTLVPTPLN